MNSQKFFAPALLLILAVLVGGFYLYSNLGGSPSQIAKVTPINSPLRATMPFLSPVVIEATPEPLPQIAVADDSSDQVVVASAPTADISAMLNLTVPITASASSGDGSAGAVFTDAQVTTGSNDATQGDATQGDEIAEAQPVPTSNVPQQPHGIPTPIPADGDLARGEALAQMLEIDQVWEVEPENPLSFDNDPIPLDLTEFFNDDFDPWTGTPPSLTDKLLSLDGEMVELKGYMAPPLKLGLDWFLLTDFPVGVCPYHSNVSSITAGMALIYVEGPEFPFTYEPLRLVGELHVGELADPETGMVSIARLYTQKEEIGTLSLSP